MGSGPMNWSAAHLSDELESALDSRRIAAVVGDLGAAITVFDRELRLVAWNDAAGRMFRWPPELVGRHLPLREDDLSTLHAALEGRRSHLSTFGVSHDGHEVIASAVVAPVVARDGRVVAAIIASIDRTVEVSTARRARLQQRRQAVLVRLGRLAMQDVSDVDVVRAAVALTSRLLPGATVDVGIVDRAAALRPLDGDQPQELDAATLEAITSWPRDGGSAAGHVVHAATIALPGRTSVFLERADDGEVLALVARTTSADGWSAADLRFLSSVASVLAMHLWRRRVAAALRARTLFDDLTGLANRSHLVDMLGRVLAARNGPASHAGLLFFDVDRFKQLNDRFGHKGGDAVLGELARRLAATAQPGDTVARLSGDEFVALCRGVRDETQLLEAANRFTEALTRPFLIANRHVRVTASCGAALVAGSADEEDALRRADLAMYEAKRRGRARVQCFSPELGAARQRELQIDATLRERASSGSFALAFQPRYGLVDGELVAVQTRITAAGMDVGHSPRFIQVADELGTSVGMVADAIAAALSSLRPILAWSPATGVVVELPADMLGETAVVATTLETLAGLDIPAARLTLQATGAGVFGTDASPIDPQLTAAGVRFAVTDLGAESTSLGGLYDPWAQEVLLAEDLVQQLGPSHVAREFTMAAAGLAIGLGLTVVGNGVTDASQLPLLHAAGCHAAQGPLWGDAMTVSELQEWIARGPHGAQVIGPVEHRPVNLRPGPARRRAPGSAPG